MIVVSHDLELLFEFAESFVVLSDGKIIYTGTPRTITHAAEQLDCAGIGLPPISKTLRLLQATYPQLNPGKIRANDAVEEILAYLPKP